MLNPWNIFAKTGAALNKREVLSSPPVQKDEYLYSKRDSSVVPGTVTAQLTATPVFGRNDRYKLTVVVTATPFNPEDAKEYGWRAEQPVKSTSGKGFTRTQAERLIDTFDGEGAPQKGFRSTRKPLITAATVAAG